MSRTAWARALSIAGHPALLMPLAVAGGGNAAGGGPGARATLAAGLGAAVFIALCVGAYTAWRVKAGRWSHVDASQPRERLELNLFLVALLFGMAALLAALGQPAVTGLGLALGGALVAAALALRRWGKVSLHAGFAVLAVALLWAQPLWALAAALLAAGVAWSRLVLQRHTRAEVAAGLALGALAGACFVGMAARLGA
jgi:membrane-associated phospholipid phosphatase